MALEHLNDVSSSDLQTWLFEALHDRVPLPRLTADEAPDVAILAAEHALDKPTRRDLARACRNLVHDFIRSGEGSVEYVRGLLRVAAGLEVQELSGALAELARRFPGLPNLDLKLKQAVLLTIVDLKINQPADFWWDLFKHDPEAFAGAALSGLLAQSWRSGLTLLRRFPDSELLASVASVLLDQAVEDLPPAQRAECLSEIARIAPGCPPALRSALQEVLDEYMSVNEQRREERRQQAAADEVPGEDRAASTPQEQQLQEALRNYSETVAAHVGSHPSPRLVPIASPPRGPRPPTRRPPPGRHPRSRKAA